jgi:LmbE family N-acetylglucosaminyl deacetylase/SAM-dependent methyltransferase
MTMSFSHLDVSPSQDFWHTDQRWARTARIEDRQLRGLRSLVLVAAHPDDETLGAAGLLAVCAAAGLSLRVVVVTDGEASHPNSATYTAARLGRLRRREVRHAVQLMAPGTEIEFLGLPDGEVGGHTDTLQRRLRAIVEPVGVGALLVTPWRLDGHPDHDALGMVGARVAAATGALHLQYPIWAWHRPDREGLPWAQLAHLPLPSAVVSAKRAAVAAHHSQVRPLSAAAGDETLLSASFLAHFDRDVETFIDEWGRLSEHIFERLHARHADPWQVRGSRYERRKRAATLATLPRRRYRRVFEPGCSIGELSAALAPRCGHLLAADVSESAVRAARRRLSRFRHVTVRRATLPQAWPPGRFDLIVISELGYFLGHDDLALLLDRARASLAGGGQLLLCHWRGEVDGWPLDGDRVHEIAAERLRLPRIAHHLTSRFRVDVFAGTS